MDTLHAYLKELMPMFRSPGSPRLSLCLALLTGSLLLVGCSREPVTGPASNVTVTAERGFVASRSAYQWWPTDGQSLFSANGCGFNTTHLDFGGSCHNGEEVIVLVAVVVAVYLVAEVTEVGYHHVHGVQLALRLEGQGQVSMYPITWGTSRLALPPGVFVPLAAGDLRALIVADGTRHLRIPIPASSWASGAVQHALCLEAGGAVVVDDHRICPTPALR